MSQEGVSGHVSALLGPMDRFPGLEIDAAAYELQQASGRWAVMMKLTLSKADSNGAMRVFARLVVVASEGGISYVQVDNISLSIWVSRQVWNSRRLT
jgi:hypothetical protein